jgi:hypothetical protein
MAHSLSGVDPRGPRRGVKGCGGTPPGTLGLAALPAGATNLIVDPWRLRIFCGSRGPTRVGFGRIVASKIEAPNMLVHLV